MGPPPDLVSTNGDRANHGNALEKIDENPENYFLGPPNYEKNTIYHEKKYGRRYQTGKKQRERQFRRS